MGLIYYATAYLCFMRKQRAWLYLFAAVSILGVVRQFNLQVLLTESMQSEAHSGGWYEDRRERQLYFLVAIAIAAALLLSLLLWLVRKRLSDAGLAVLGIVLLAALLIVRATSHHYVDMVLMMPALGLRPAYLLELVGLAMIAGPLLLRRMRDR